MSNTDTYPYKHEGALHLPGASFPRHEECGKYLRECLDLSMSKIEFQMGWVDAFGVTIAIEIWSKDPELLPTLEGILIRTAVTFHGQHVLYLAQF